MKKYIIIIAILLISGCCTPVDEFDSKPEYVTQIIVD